MVKKIRWRSGICPDTAGGAYSIPQTLRLDYGEQGRRTEKKGRNDENWKVMRVRDVEGVK